LLYSPVEVSQASVPSNLTRNKKVIGIIMGLLGLLKDRAYVEKEFDRKRPRMEGYRSKKIINVY
jgi:hypothetical protein